MSLKKQVRSLKEKLVKLKASTTENNFIEKEV